MFKKLFNKKNDKDIDKRVNTGDYDNEINKFITSNNPEDINTYLVLDFLLDKKNVLINKQYIDFCNKQMCIENVNFIYVYHDLILLKKYNDILQKSIEIYYLFIDLKSKTQLNLDSNMVSKIKTILKIDEDKSIFSSYKSRLYTRSMKDRIKNVYSETYDHIRMILTGNTIIDFIKEYHLFNLGDAISDANSIRSSKSSHKSNKSIKNDSDRSNNDKDKNKNDSDRSNNDKNKNDSDRSSNNSDRSVNDIDSYSDKISKLSHKSNKSPSLTVQSKMIETISRKLSRTDSEIDLHLKSIDDDSPTLKNQQRKLGVRRNSVINYDNPIVKKELDIIKENNN